MAQVLIHISFTFTDLYAHAQISVSYKSDTDSSTRPQIRRHTDRFLHRFINHRTHTKIEILKQLDTDL